MHHRIKNNIASISSLISLRSQTTPNRDTAIELMETKTLLDSSIRVYEKLIHSTDYQQVLLKHYREDILISILDSFPPHSSLQIEKYVEEVLLDAMRAMWLGMILNELVTNAIKYAYRGKKQGRLYVLLKKMDQTVTLRWKAYKVKAQPIITLWAGFLFLGGSLLLYVFVLVGKRQPFPMLEVRLFHSNRVFAFSNLAALINYASTYAVAYLLSLYLQYIQGFSPRKAGLILLIQPLIQALCTPFAGKASDKIRTGTLVSCGRGFTVLGLVLCAWLDTGTSIPWVLGCLFLLGLGFGLFSSPNSNAIMCSVDRKDYSIASATLATMRLLGQMLSMGIALMVFLLILGDSPITPHMYPHFLKGLKILFGVFSVLNCLGVFASLARGKGTQ